MKVIYVLSHFYRGEFNKEELHKINCINHRYAQKMKEWTDRFRVECWWTEKRADQPVTVQQDGITYRVFPASGWKYPYRYISLSLLRALQRESRNGPILIFLYGLRGKWTSLIPLFIRNAPVVIQQLSEGTSYSRRRLMKRPWLFIFSKLEERAFRHVGHFFMLFGRAKEEMKRYVDPSRVSVVSCGVDFKRFSPVEKAKARKLLGLDPACHYILSVARINDRKGARYLIEAMPSILEDYPDTHLLLVGEIRRETILSNMKELSERLNVKDKVHFLGWVADSKLPLFYNAADVFALPSLTEGLGMVLVEAAACNCPIIGTEVGGIVDLMKTVNKGITVPAMSPDTLAPAVKQVFRNPSYYTGLREQAYPYSWESVLQKTVEVFENLRQEYYLEDKNLKERI